MFLQNNLFTERNEKHELQRISHILHVSNLKQHTRPLIFSTNAQIEIKQFSEPKWGNPNCRDVYHRMIIQGKSGRHLEFHSKKVMTILQW